jgi:predicted nucleotidyltransferase
MRQWLDRLWYNAAMRCAEAISLLRLHEAELKRLGVEHLYIFGSTARNEAKNDSDIDLFSIMPEASSESTS